MASSACQTASDTDDLVGFQKAILDARLCRVNLIAYEHWAVTAGC